LRGPRERGIRHVGALGQRRRFTRGEGVWNGVAMCFFFWRNMTRDVGRMRRVVPEGVSTVCNNVPTTYTSPVMFGCLTERVRGRKPGTPNKT
jgi:hypothetical protein